MLIDNKSCEEIQYYREKGVIFAEKLFMDDQEKIEAPQKAPLRYHETLDVFSDVIAEHYYECEMDVYRTVVNNPPTEFDITPARRRFANTQGPELPFVYTEDEVEMMEPEEKKAEVGHDAVSVHISDKKSIKEAKRFAASFAKKHTEEETRAYKYEQRGQYVARLHVTPDKALVSKQFHKTTGHGGLLLREGVTIDDLVDKNYEIKEFKYEDDDDKQ